MIYNITGKDNKTVKLINKLKKKKGRDENGRFIIEGRKIVQEAFQYAAEGIYCIVVSNEFCKTEPEFIRQAEKLCSHIYTVPENLFKDISDTETPQGVLAVLEIPNNAFLPQDDSRYVLILDGISEPGNMGTVIRTAEAFGFDGIYLMKGCTAIYAPKTVRATMGSIFRMKFRTGCGIDDISQLQDMGFTVLATSPLGNMPLEQLEKFPKTALVIGNEAHGVSEEVMNMANCGVRITMDGLAESLNAAVAAGIAMHWVKK